MFLPAKYRKQPYVVHRCSCIYTAILVLKKLKKTKNKTRYSGGRGRQISVVQGQHSLSTQQVQDQHSLHNKFKVSMAYILRPYYLKKNLKKKNLEYENNISSKE